ncbi:MAG TPA: hypothetical protein PKA64_23985, partial [Myxococcota bacterium]|nr:hypothetical protein [Myxococcota bacterium]
MLVLLAALGAGFRIDGAGHADAHPAPADVLWRLDLPATGNASVVGFGDMVCVTQKPTTVTCVDAATGAIRWQARHDVADAIGADDATRAAIAQAAAAQGALESLRA